MQDDFEHKINQRMQEFSISPQPEIWQRVESALPEKRRRRIAFWWWLIPLVIGTGLSLRWVGNNRSVNEPKQVAQQKANENKTTSSTNVETPVPSIRDSIPSPTETATIYSKQNPDITAKEKIANTIEDSSTQYQKPVVAVERNKKTSDKKNNPFTYSSSVKANVKVVRQNDKEESPIATVGKSNINTVLQEKQLQNEHDELKAKKVLQNSNAVSEPKNEDDLVLQSGNDLNQPTVVKADSTVLVSATIPGANDTTVKKEVTVSQKDTVQKDEVVAKKKSAKSTGNKKVVWLADAAIGTSWLKGTSSLDKALLDATNQYFSSPGTIGAGTGNSSSFRNFARPGVGYSLSLGFVRRQEFNKHLSWQTALHYQLLSATQRVGSVVDTPSIYSRASAPSLIYNTGNIRTYRNVVHQLQFSPGLVLTLNPTAHSPFSITTGAAVAYNVSNNLLLHDYRSNTYIRSARSSSKIQYSAYLGVDISIQKKLQLGLVYQHSFSNVAKGNLGSDYQWRQLQLHVSLPISK